MRLFTIDDFQKISQRNQEDGLTPEKEANMRNEIIKFIQELGYNLLRIKHQTIIKAIIIFHQFSAHITFKKFDYFLYGATTLFLASKDDDEPRYLKETVIQYLHALEMHKNNQGSVVIVSQEQIDNFNKKINQNQEIIQITSDKICLAESHILKMLGYDLDVESSLKYIAQLRKQEFLKFDKNIEKVFYEKLKMFTQDFYRPNLCLIYEPLIIALAAIKQTKDLFNLDMEEQQNLDPWYNCFGTQVDYQEVLNANNDFEKFVKLLKGIQ